MSEEVSSSTSAAGSKHARDEITEVGEAEQPKRQRLNDDAGPCTSSTGAASASGSGEGVTGSGDGVSGDGVTSESDDEYLIGGSESDGDVGEDDAESSDISAEEEDEVEEGEGSNIICGQSVELRQIRDGKYRLFHQPSGREIKLLLSQELVTSTEKLAREIQAENQIAVLDAQGTEVTRDDHDEIIVYATSLVASDTKYHFLEEEDDIDHEVSDNNTGILLQGNRLVALRLDGVNEVFATGDFNEQALED